jgi:ribonuclease HII
MIGFNMEQNLFRQGRDYLVGVDEVGRGCLAGPVVAAAVGWMRPPGQSLSGRRLLRALGGDWASEVRDSKQLSPHARAVLLKAINSSGLVWSIGSVSPQMIDEINIHHASLLAMRRAVVKLRKTAFHSKVSQTELLVDGRFTIPFVRGRQQAIVGGDAKVFLVAVASIVAKQWRDALMEKLHRHRPEYGYDRHKGYATAFHRQAIATHGLTQDHRRSFCGRVVSGVLAAG